MRSAPRGLWVIVELTIWVGALLALWYAFIRLLDLDPYLAKTPDDVWAYLVSDDESASHRAELLDQLRITVVDAALGFIVGTAAAIVVALGIVWNGSIERSLMPLIITLRSVPLVAMTPLIALVFGRGLGGVIVVGALVTFFPTLVNMVQALRSVSESTVNVMLAYGASPFTILYKVQLPTAVPALFASARIAAPAALLGATLAEWMVTGRGLGNLMLESTSTSRFDTLWTVVALLVVLSIGFYVVVGYLERLAVARYAPERE
jgi:ABC-type nitrate/sulfonate/bicarbonate transport system permease component